jgi:polyhydroxyalkanoate synthase
MNAREQPLADSAFWVPTCMDAVQIAQFSMGDVLRQAQGAALDAFGFGPQECAYQLTSSGPYWRLRDYASHNASPSLIIVAAPIKRPYIWDLAPPVSAIRRCLREGLHVYLLEWLPDSRRNQNNGLDEYMEAIAECVTRVSCDSGDKKPFLAGHSLGGTLAAIFGSLTTARIQGLVLLEAPLCFAPATSRFRDAVVSLIPQDLSDAVPFPGSLLSLIACLAAPDTFIGSRLMDAALSATDSRALEINTRVERWSLDEASLPGKLVKQILEWLYRENRFCRGILEVNKTFVGPATLSTATLVVVNVSDDVAPLASIQPCIDAMPVSDVRVVQYPGDTGVGLQHLGVLIGRKAHSQVWPKIISWIKIRG